MRSRRDSERIGEGAEIDDAAAVAPGRVTRSQGLPLQKKTAGAAPTDAAAADQETAETHEDPFGVHLLASERKRVADADGGPGHKPRAAVEAELERLIERADWSKLRPAAYAEASIGAESRAQERRDGTQPDLTGMGKIGALDRVAHAMKAVQGRWSRLSLSERKTELERALDAELVAANIPPLDGIIDIPGKTHPASFDYRIWQVKVRTELLAGDSLTDADAADLCGTLVHEVRHAEQQFLAARVLASQGTKTPEIVAKLHGLHAPVAAKAAALKLAGLGGAELVYANQMHTALVTDRETNDILDADTGYAAMARIRAQARKALDGLRQRPPAITADQARSVCRQLHDQIDDVLLKYKIYRQLPTESDAHDVGAGAKLAFQELA